MILIRYFIAYLISFIISITLTSLLTQSKNKNKRKNEIRWSQRDVPRIGGIAIFLSWFLPMTLLASPSPIRYTLSIGALFIFLIGLIDDLYNLPAYIKLLLQTVVLIWVVHKGIKVECIKIPLLREFITLLWLIFITNAFNLIDNMDGLCAGTSLIATLNLFILSIIYPSYNLSTIIMFLAGAITGFLLFNYPPAKIFMGDSGSLFLGFTLGSIGIIGSWKDVAHISIVIILPLLIFIVPVFDTLFVYITRRIRGVSFFQGGIDHTSHRLVSIIGSEKKVVLFFYLISVIGGIVMFSLTTISTLWIRMVIVLVVIIISFIFGWILGSRGFPSRK